MSVTIHDLQQRLALTETDVFEVDNDSSTDDTEKVTFSQMGGLVPVVGTEGDIIMEVGKQYYVDMSTWSNAGNGRTWTLPTTARAGERIGVVVTVGSPNEFLAFTASPGDSLNDVPGGTEWSRVFIANESLVFKCDEDSNEWQVEIDGRQPCLTRLFFNDTQSVLNGWLKVRMNNIEFDIGDLGDITSDAHRCIIRRAGVYLCIGGTGMTGVGENTRNLCGIYKNNALAIQSPRWYNQPGAGSAMEANVLGSLQLVPGDHIETWNNHGDSGQSYPLSTAPDRMFLVVMEQLVK